jgi:geranylgeranyl pyrophosphate synthase
LLLKEIYEPIQEDLAGVEETLRSIIKVDFSWLSEMLEYSLSGSGKRIRPALTLLSGRFFDYNIESLQPMAAAIELMHTATLVHDDAIDKSFVRRGRSTINGVWGEEKAVLLGDYLFARAGEFATNTNNIRVVRLFTQTLGTISSGELSQTFSAFNVNQTREDYIGRIARKTASLFSLATESGAILSQAPESAVQSLREYGYNLGIAFQIVDDILDFAATEEEVGKPVGSDLVQGTLTLPAMLLLEQYRDNNPVKSLFNHEDVERNIELAIEIVRNSSIVDDCFNIASDYCARACHSIEGLPDNHSHRALIELTGYICRRGE